MNEWAEGYTADINYTYGYYPELNPLRLKLAFLNAGLAFPKVGNACELGYGLGVTVNMHAAATTTSWYGTDFNPAHANIANEFATAAESGARLFDESFEEFCRRDDLPNFDYIGLHGIWCWVSPNNRSIIKDFIRRKLNVGGVVYISYNTFPGWANFAPVRHLLNEHANSVGSKCGGSKGRAEGALGFIEGLLKTKTLYSQENPRVAARVDALHETNRDYLVHEYFNDDWDPIYFSSMAESMSSAKLTFACSAHYLDLVPSINLSEEQQKFIADIPGADFRETARDFMVNQQFRRDYWVKGARQLSRLEQISRMQKLIFVLAALPEYIKMKNVGIRGEYTLNEDVYRPIINCLGDHKPKSLADMEAEVATQGVNLAQLVESLIMLVGLGHIALAQEHSAIKRVKPHTEKLNSYLLDMANVKGNVGYLASPITGGGIAVGRLDQLFLLGFAQGLTETDEFAQAVWKLLSAQGQNLTKEGIELKTEEENIVELRRLAEIFANKHLALYQALLIV